MRKEIVYSLAAVAAIPVVASAAESGASAKGLTIVAANGQLKLTVNPQTGLDEGVFLKAGKYQLFLEELTSGQTNMTVTIKNLDTEATQTATIQSGTNTKSTTFELAEGIYSIWIDGPTGFSGSGAAIQFLFDFQAASTTLKTILVNYVNEIENFHNIERASDVSNFNKWQGVIDSLGMVNYADEFDKLAKPTGYVAGDEGTWSPEQKAFKAAYLKTSLNEAQVNAKAYAMYENYNLAALSSETEKTAIEEAMEALYADAKAHEADHMRDSLQDLRDAVKDVPVNSSTMASDSTAIKGLIADFESGEATSDQVWTAIENMKADVENALAIAEFYKNTAKPYFDAAKKALANEKKAIMDGLNAIPSYDETKETLKADANTRFTSIETKLTNLSDSLDRAYADGSLGSDETQLKWGTDAGFKKAVDDIAKWTKVDEDTLCDKNYASLLKDTVAVYGKLTELRLVADTVGSPTIKKPSAAFLAAHYGSFGYIDSVYAKAIALKPALNIKMRGKVNTAIANLNDTISKYSHKNPVGLDQTELTDATKGVAKYVKILDDSVKNYIDSLKNYQVMLDSIDSLTMRLDTVVARLDAKYGKTLKNIGDAKFGTTSTDDPFYFLNPNNKEEEYATSVIKKDKTPLFIKKDKALYTDSIRKAITDLNATIANYKSEETQEAVDKTNGTFGKAAKAIFDDIESLENTAAGPIEKFVKVQTTLDSLFTELNAFETQIQNLDIYKKSVKDYSSNANPAPMIGGYKDKIDSIRTRKLNATAFAITASAGTENMNSSLAKIQAQLDSARIARGISRAGETSSKTFSWWMNQVAYADTASLKKCIDLLKKSYKADSIAFAANADQAAFDNLKKSVRELCDSINKIITRVEGEITAENPKPYGDATANIQQMLNNVKDSLCKNELGGIVKEDRTYATNVGDDKTYYNATLERAAEATVFSATMYDLLGKDAEKLQQLLSKLGQVKQAVEIEKEAQAKNAAAKASLDNYFAKFFEAYNAAKALVENGGSCVDVYQTTNNKIADGDFKSANQWYKDSLGVTTSQDPMTTPAQYAAAAWTPEKSIMDKFKKLYNAIVAAQNAGTLVGDTTTYKLKIDTLIADLKGVTDSLKIKQNNLSALITIESFDPSIQELVVDADTKLEAVEDKTNSNSAYAHYKAVIDAMKEGYQGTTSLPTRGENDEDAVEGLLDKAFADYKGDSLNRTQEIYLPAVLQTMLDLRKVEKRATENKENLPDVKSDSLRVANKITALLTELDSYEFGKNKYVTALNGLQTELAAIKVDTLYKYGKLENDSLDNGRQKDIKKIEEKIDSIRLETVGADNYDKLVEDLQLRKKLDSKAKETRGVYNEAVALDDAYLTLRSKTLRDAVAAAKAESDAYNQALKAYPAQINAAYNKADSSITAYRADEDTRLESYPADKFKSDTAAFNTIASDIKALSAEYKATADAAIGTSASTFLAAVSATLDDSTHFFNKYAAYDTTSTNAQMLAYKDFIAKLAGQKAVLVKKIADLNKTINGIKDLDDILYDLENWKEGNTNTLGTSYADKNADVLKDAAKHDLTTGETQAKEAIKKGNKFYYNQETITVTDGTELNEAWEAKKLPILGKAATATTEKIPGVGDSIGTIKPANHEFKYDSISAILDTFLEDTEILIQSEDAYNRWNAALGAANAAANAKGSLQAQLNKAKDDAKNYVVIDDMVNNGGFKTIQDVIDQKRAAAEALREAGLCTFTATDSLDSVKISREIQIVSKLVKDTLKTDSDVYLPNIVESNTLFRKEQAYLEGLEDQLWSLFNQAAANKWAEDDENVRVKKGQEYEAELIDIYHDLDSIVTEVNADSTKADAAKLLAIQNRIDELTKGMVAAAGQLGENTQANIKNDLDAAAQAVQDKLTAAAALDKSGLTDAQKAAINDEKNSIQTALNETKIAIAEAKTAKDLPLKEGQFEDKIAALDKKVDALTQKINELNEQNDALTANYAAADATLKTLDEALENLEKAFEKFESIDEDEYANRLALVDSRANDIKDGVQDAKDEKKAVDNTKLTSDVNTLVSDINALIKEAANDDLSELGEDLEEQVDELIAEKNLNENKFLASDKTSLTNALNTLKNAIATYDDNSGELNGGYRNEVYNNGNPLEYTAYDALKKKGDSLQARIDSLAERMEILLNGGEIPVVTIPGDIDGDGFVTSDDVEAFLDKLQNDLLPEDDDDDFEIYDVNGDEVLNIADAQAILNLSLGLNWDGTEIVVEDDDDPGEAPARRVEAPAGKITAETQQLENGAQRITLTLNGNFDWTGFQLDVKGAEVLSETASQSLRTADLKNGAHRIVAFGTAQGNGRVITIDVQGNAQLGTITFTTANAEAVSFKLSGTTGIYGITTESSNIFYDLSGKLVKGMKKGVNIIRDAAGKAKKAIMK